MRRPCGARARGRASEAIDALRPHYSSLGPPKVSPRRLATQPTCTDTSSPDASDSVPISRISSWAQACSTSSPRRPLRQHEGARKRGIRVGRWCTRGACRPLYPWPYTLTLPSTAGRAPPDHDSRGPAAQLGDVEGGGVKGQHRVDQRLGLHWGGGGVGVGWEQRGGGGIIEGQSCRAAPHRSGVTSWGYRAPPGAASVAAGTHGYTHTPRQRPERTHAQAW